MPRISALPGAPTPTLTDIFPEVQPAVGGTTYKATFNQLMQLYQKNLVTPANGGIVYTDSTQLQLLAPTATANQILQSGSNTAPHWSTATYPATTTISQFLYSSSNNVVAGLATVNRAVLGTNATGVPVFSALSDGQVVIGSTSGFPTGANLTAATGVKITNGSNTISIAATGMGLNWSESSGSFTAVIGHGYFSTTAAVITLPASPAVGDCVAIACDTNGLVTITANTGQMLRVGKVLSAVAGTSASSSIGDTLYFVFKETDSTWFATSIIGNWIVT